MAAPSTADAAAAAAVSLRSKWAGNGLTSSRPNVLAASTVTLVDDLLADDFDAAPLSRSERDRLKTTLDRGLTRAAVICADKPAALERVVFAFDKLLRPGGAKHAALAELYGAAAVDGWRAKLARLAGVDAAPPAAAAQPSAAATPSKGGKASRSRTAPTTPTHTSMTAPSPPLLSAGGRSGGGGAAVARHRSAAATSSGHAVGADAADDDALAHGIALELPALGPAAVAAAPAASAGGRGGKGRKPAGVASAPTSARKLSRTSSVASSVGSAVAPQLEAAGARSRAGSAAGAADDGSKPTVNTSSGVSGARRRRSVSPSDVDRITASLQAVLLAGTGPSPMEEVAAEGAPPAVAAAAPMTSPPRARVRSRAGTASSPAAVATPTAPPAAAVASVLLRRSSAKSAVGSVTAAASPLSRAASAGGGGIASIISPIRSDGVACGGSSDLAEGAAGSVVEPLVDIAGDGGGDDNALDASDGDLDADADIGGAARRLALDDDAAAATGGGNDEEVDVEQLMRASDRSSAASDSSADDDADSGDSDTVDAAAAAGAATAATSRSRANTSTASAGPSLAASAAIVRGLPALALPPALLRELDCHLLARFRADAPSSAEEARKRAVVEQVERAVARAFRPRTDRRLGAPPLPASSSTSGGATVHVFGSSANAFGTASADIDVCIQLPRPAPPVDGAAADGVNPAAAPSPLAAFSSVLGAVRAGGFVNIVPLRRARVPIIKATHGGTGIDVDLSFGNELAVHNTRLLHTYAQLDARVRPLVFAVKAWAKARGVAGAADHNLSSYAFVLLALFYLQQPEGGRLLPSLQDPALMREWGAHVAATGATTAPTPPAWWPRSLDAPLLVDGFDVRFVPDAGFVRAWWARNRPRLPRGASAVAVAADGRHGSLSPGELFAGFVDYYALRFPWTQGVVCPRTGRVERRRVFRDAPGGATPPSWRLAIEDPFELSHDLGRVLTERRQMALWAEFHRSRQALEEAAAAGSLAAAKAADGTVGRAVTTGAYGDGGDDHAPLPDGHPLASIWQEGRTGLGKRAEALGTSKRQKALAKRQMKAAAAAAAAAAGGLSAGGVGAGIGGGAAVNVSQLSQMSAVSGGGGGVARVKTFADLQVAHLSTLSVGGRLLFVEEAPPRPRQPPPPPPAPAPQAQAARPHTTTFGPLPVPVVPDLARDFPPTLPLRRDSLASGTTGSVAGSSVSRPATATAAAGDAAAPAPGRVLWSRAAAVRPAQTGPGLPPRAPAPPQQQRPAPARQAGGQRPGPGPHPQQQQQQGPVRRPQAAAATTPAAAAAAPAPTASAPRGGGAGGGVRAVNPRLQQLALKQGARN